MPIDNLLPYSLYERRNNQNLKQLWLNVGSVRVLVAELTIDKKDRISAKIGSYRARINPSQGEISEMIEKTIEKEIRIYSAMFEDADIIARFDEVCTSLQRKVNK